MNKKHSGWKNVKDNRDNSHSTNLACFWFSDLR
uniref:Uncharacterized protein n=1 Tax=Anguilla anguilla TaxID=7936 RepID=A0A0E9SAY2_ANGAN